MLQEEMDAWENGETLAKSLSVRYNQSVLEKDRVKALMTYVQHTACRMRMSEEEQVVRTNLASALSGFVKFEVARSKLRTVAVKKLVKKKRHRANSHALGHDSRSFP
jgi:hypothetical protein